MDMHLISRLYLAIYFMLLGSTILGDEAWIIIPSQHVDVSLIPLQLGNNINGNEISVSVLDSYKFQKEMSITLLENEQFSYNLLFLLAVFPVAVFWLINILYITSILYCIFKLHKKSNWVEETGCTPSVSIIKPLMGLDPLLESNLESHFTLKYSKFEILFCVEDESDPVISLVEKLIKKHPEVDSKLLVGGEAGILNPLVSNCVPGFKNAKYDFIWVSTSRIKANTDILLDMIGKIQHPKIAMVHQLPFIEDRSGFISILEKVFFGINIAKYYLSVHVFGFNLFVGMSYLLKKQPLESVGGFAAFGNCLAEDFFMSEALFQKGYRFEMAAYPAKQNVADIDLKLFKDRLVRWSQLRMSMIPFRFLLFEPLGEVLPSGVCLGTIFYYFLGVNPFKFFIIHSMIRVTLDYILLRLVQGEQLPFSKLHFLSAWLLWMFMHIYVSIEAILNSKYVRWGTKIFELTNFGEKIKIINEKYPEPV